MIPGNPLTFPPLNMGMNARNSPFREILDFYAKLQPSVRILRERELRIPGMIQRMNKKKKKLERERSP